MLIICSLLADQSPHGKLTAMSQHMSPSSEKQPDRKITKPVTAKRLENIALYYLGRYAASSESLRRVLMRRVSKSAYHHNTDPAEGARWVEDIIGRFLKSGILDDYVYADGLAKSLYRRGLSQRAIQNRLLAKGIDREILSRQLKAMTENNADPDLRAAFLFARRRRLGPFRPADQRSERRDRDLASLARGGFDFETAKKVIDAETPDSLQHMIGQ